MEIDESQLKARIQSLRHQIDRLEKETAITQAVCDGKKAGIYNEIDYLMELIRETSE
jgi:hypothetical protein